MRLKDPFSLKAADMTKRTNKPRKPRDEESSDEVSGKLWSVTGHLWSVGAVSGLHWQNGADHMDSKWRSDIRKLNCFVSLIRLAVPACQQSSGPGLCEEICNVQRVVHVRRVPKREDDERRRASSVTWHSDLLKVWFPSKICFQGTFSVIINVTCSSCQNNN